ncbi:MAG: TIGR04190 family B12-binding domain/radical SAM domain protein [Carboxydocellales bacterium]
MIKRFFQRDLIFLHPPSVYDFRKDTILFGPISDVVPSSAAFEMYPMGITSIADTLERDGFNVQIINLAYQMLRNVNYDVEKVIARLNPKAFAIDLHWLPHAQGSLEIAKIVKKYHPQTPVLMGGLSASYYHEELIRYPFVDFVIRGDSTEEPMRQLMRGLFSNEPFDCIPNLTWKHPDGSVVVNPLTYVPDNLDYAPIPSYKYVVSSVFKYLNLHNAVPYLEWLSYPTTVLLTARGCTQNCSVCGGSRFAYRKICNRTQPAFRSPRVLVEDIKLIQSIGQAPIFILHDLRQAGLAYAEEFFKLLGKEKIKNELIIELFYPADESFFAMVAKAVPKFSLEITLETHDEELRKLNGKFKCSNAEFEATMAAAYKYGCRKIDIFFMTGIPKQTYTSVMETIDYCQLLLELFPVKQRLALFIAPLAPFLDPGCLAFEYPEKYGYKKFCHSLEDHRQALNHPSWKHILSYETDAMTREQIVEATYAAANRLNQLKFNFGLIEAQVYEDIKYRINIATETISQIDQILLLPDLEEQRQELGKLKEKVGSLNRHTICGRDELKWPLGKRFTSSLALFRLLAGLLGVELRRTFKKALGLSGRDTTSLLPTPNKEQDSKL